MQYKPSDGAWDPESTAGFWVNRASRTLLRRFDERLQPLGFSMSHLPVLRALAESRSLSQKELAQIACIGQPAMTEMLSRLERDGVIVREPNPDDRRGSLVSLTPKARGRLSKATAALVEAEREAMAGLSEAERGSLRELLRRVVSSVDATENREERRTP